MKEGKKIFSMFPRSIFPPPDAWLEVLKLFRFESYFPKVSGAIFPFISIWFDAENICSGKKEKEIFATVVSAKAALKHLKGTAKRKSIMEKKMLITWDFSLHPPLVKRQTFII